MPTAKKISIIIPTCGQRDYLLGCLKSIRALKDPALEVLIVLNNGELSDFPLLENEQLLHCEVGANLARNYGMDHAQGDIIYFMDDDCQIQNPQQFKIIRNYLERHQEVCGVGGLYQPPENANLLQRIYNRNALTWIESSVYATPKTLFLLGGNFAVRSNGACRFDAGIEWGGSELSYFIQAAKKQQIFHLLPEIEVLHTGALTLGKFVSKLKKQAATTEKLLKEGQLVRLESNTKPSTQSWGEKIVSGLIQFIFMTDKSGLLLYALFLPFRIIPRKWINRLYRDLAGALIISK